MLATLRDPKIKAVGAGASLWPGGRHAAADGSGGAPQPGGRRGLRAGARATVGGRLAGTWGQLAAFSFYPTKNLGALGDWRKRCAAAIRSCWKKPRSLRQYGWRKRYVSESAGRNSRLDELQAGDPARTGCRGLRRENARRAALAAQYLAGLNGVPLRLPVTAAERGHCWHQFVVRTPRREELRVYLEKKDIICGVLYPVPMHRQPAYHDATLYAAAQRAGCAEVLSAAASPGIERRRCRARHPRGGRIFPVSQAGGKRRSSFPYRRSAPGWKPTPPAGDQPEFRGRLTAKAV